MVFSGKNIEKGKKAGLSLEMSLSIALAIVVLFAVLNIFNANLKGMVANSNFNNLFNRKQDTSFEHTNKDYSQANVQIVGQQGLQKTVAQYRDEAMNTINEIASHSTLSPEDKLNLARALTVYAESGAITDTTANSFQNDALASAKVSGGQYNGLSFAELAQNKDIDIRFSWNYSKTMIAGQPSIFWSQGQGIDDVKMDSSSSDSYRADILKGVSSAFK